MQYIYFSWPVKYFIIPERLFQNDNHDSNVLIVHCKHNKTANVN